MTKWYIALLCLLIFLIPSNLFFKLDISHAYVHGLLVDYLIPKLYVSDLPILAILVLWLKEQIDQKKLKDIKSPVVLLFSLLAVVFFSRQLVTGVPRASLWFFIKLAEMCCLSLFLISHHTLLKAKMIWMTLGFTAAFQAVLGIIQFYTQSSVFHTYKALGEVDYSHTIGLAKDSYFSTTNILAYGTTAHPNILGGFLAISGLLVFDKFYSSKAKKSIYLKIGAIIFFAVLAWALILTQSVSAAITLGVGLLFVFFKRELPRLSRSLSSLRVLFVALLFLFVSCCIVPFLLHSGAERIPGNQSFTRRDNLNQAAESMIMKNPIMGVGLNNFTVKVEAYEPAKESVRFIQPVHNVALLWVAETGVIGVLLIGMAYYVFKQKTLENWPNKGSFVIPLSILLPVFALDHYLLTQQTGLLLSVLFIFIFQLGEDNSTVTE